MTEGRHYVIDAPRQPAIPIAGSDLFFPVRRIWCVGRNYADHALEMGADPLREPPFFFAKPADAVVPGGGFIAYPPATGDLQHEVELAVAIGRGGADIDPAMAALHVFGYAVALDMTRRDLQAEAKRMARPWDMAKGFDQSCPIGKIRPAESAGALTGTLRLDVNGKTRQQATLSEMIWPIADCIAALSTLVELKEGDLLLTGTPAGVAAVGPGDVLLASCEGVGELRVAYHRRPERQMPL